MQHNRLVMMTTYLVSRVVCGRQTVLLKGKSKIVSDIPNFIMTPPLCREMTCFSVKKKERMVTRKVQVYYPAVVCNFNVDPFCV